MRTVSAHRSRVVAVVLSWLGGLLTVFPAAGACLLPDNGMGTADLPPYGCYYEGQPLGGGVKEKMYVIDGLAPGTTVEISPRLYPSASGTEAPGGTLGGDVQIDTEMIQMQLVGTGLLGGYGRTVSIPGVYVETYSAARVGGSPVQGFVTDLYLLQGQLPAGDPDFDLLRITAGTGFGMPSPGHTTLTQVGGDQWAIDSFFDITYRIDFVGKPGGVFAGQSGSTTGTLRMVVAPEPGSLWLCAVGLPALLRRRGGRGSA
ncbi:MAG: hypothetical protein IT442_07100 [Phycisphaeraceae bacterium]|nr:hypothetical protein [Phycisphaeraceae bacterium]